MQTCDQNTFKTYQTGFVNILFLLLSTYLLRCDAEWKRTSTKKAPYKHVEEIHESV